MPVIPKKFLYFALGPSNMEGKKLQCFAKNETEFRPFFGHPLWYKLYPNTPRINVVTSDVCYSKKKFLYFALWKVKNSIFCTKKKAECQPFFWTPCEEKFIF